MFYIHTQPYLAWIYTLLRESNDNRRIPIKQFIEFYHLAYKNIKLALQKFDAKIIISIAQKIRDKNDNIVLEETLYYPHSIEELNDIFDKKIRLYYNL